MVQKRKGLGRGLGALGLGTAQDIFEAPAKPKAESHRDEKEGRLMELEVSRLSPGKYQPRTHMDPESIASLAASIKSQGLMSPLVVRPIGKDSWEIIAGERRFRAAKMAGMTTVPVLVRNVPDKQALSLSLIENIQREELNPIEEANGMNRLISEFGLTQDQVAESLGKSRPAVANTLRLLKLCAHVQNLLINDKLSMGHARALIPLQESDQVVLATQAVQKGWSVREMEMHVAELGQEERRKVKEPPKPRVKSRDIVRIEESLSETFGTEVKLTSESKEKGKLVFRYTSLEQLSGLLKQFGYSSE